MPVSHAGNAGGSPKGAMIPIGSVTVTTATSDIQFFNIPQTYTDLRVVLSARRTGANYVEGFLFNYLDVSASLSGCYILNNSGSVYNGINSNQDAVNGGYVPGASASATIWGTTIIDIFNYSNTNTYKTVMFNSQCDSNSGYGANFLGVGVSKGSTGGVTTFDIATFSGSDLWAVGTTAQLFGIRTVGK